MGWPQDRRKMREQVEYQHSSFSALSLHMWCEPWPSCLLPCRLHHEGFYPQIVRQNKHSLTSILLVFFFITMRKVTNTVTSNIPGQAWRQAIETPNRHSWLFPDEVIHHGGMVEACGQRALHLWKKICEAKKQRDRENPFISLVCVCSPSIFDLTQKTHCCNVSKAWMDKILKIKSTGNRGNNLMKPIVTNNH